MNREPIGLDFETVSGLPHPGDECEDKATWQAWSRAMHPERGGHVRLVQLAWPNGICEIIDLYDRVMDLSDLEEYLESMGPYVCHNASFEQLYLRDAGIRVETYDTMIMDAMLRSRATSYDDDAGIRQYRSLDEVAGEVINDHKAGDEQSSDWSGTLTTVQLEYAIKDAVLVRDMWPVMLDSMSAQFHAGVEMMMQAIGPTASVNLHGLEIDPVAHQVLIAELSSEAKQMKEELVTASGVPPNPDGKPFNPASGKQVTQLIDVVLTSIIGEFWIASVPWHKTKNGQLNLNKGYITAMLPKVEAFAPQLSAWLAHRVRWRGKQKLVDAFGKTLTTLTDDDLKVRGEYKIHGAVTGRYSCARPNLQQIPSKTDARFRTLFVAPSGRVLVIADFSQIELRIAGLASGDPNFERIFRDGLDIHAQTAAQMFNIDVPSDLQRKAAKAVNFGVIYGATAPTIALSSGFSVDEAGQFLTAWLNTYPVYDSWTGTFNKQAKRDGHFATAGNRRILVDPNAAATKLKNYPIQASAADVLYQSLIEIDLALYLTDLDAKIVALIHDEFIIEASPQDAQAAADLLTGAMRRGLLSVYPGAFTGDLVDAAIVDSWAGKP